MTNKPDCKSALEAITSRRVEDFRGLPGCRLGDVEKAFKSPASAKRHTKLGDRGRAASFVNFMVDGYGEPVSAWYDGDSVFMISIEHPELAEPTSEVLQSLGEPAGKFDFSVNDAVRIEAGVWVWPDRGLALYVNPKKDNYLFRLAVFASTTLDDFAQNLKFDPEVSEVDIYSRDGK